MTNSENVEIYVSGNQYITEVTVELSTSKLEELWREETVDANLCITGCGLHVIHPHTICKNCLLDAIDQYGSGIAQDVLEILGEKDHRGAEHMRSCSRARQQHR